MSTFDDYEASLRSGRPVRLYLFERGATLKWAWTGADRAISYGGINYQPLPIEDDGIRMTGQPTADTIVITGPADMAVAKLFRGAPPGDEIFLTIRDWHWGADAATAVALVVWVGSIMTVRWPKPDRAAISCNSLSATMRRAGLRLTYERACAHTLYDKRCGVDRQAHEVTATISAMTEDTITYSAAVTGIFAGGMVTWPIDGGLTERRGIAAEDAGGVLTVLGGTGGLALGQSVSLYPGCPRTSAACAGTFNNMDNYGGFRHLPGESPFSGNQIW